MTAGPETALVVGVGNPVRGDDGVGLAVAALVRAQARPDVEVAELHGDLTALLDLWAGRRQVVLVDAVCSPAAAGTVVEVDLRRHRLPPAATASTHGFGVADVVELARGLGLLPDELVFVGVVLGEVAAGSGLSEPVRAGAHKAAARVIALVAGQPAGAVGQPAGGRP